MPFELAVIIDCDSYPDAAGGACQPFRGMIRKGMKQFFRGGIIPADFAFKGLKKLLTPKRTREIVIHNNNT
ncbi:hypothetical protein CCGE525_20950 [Rhizobium jaguaris]|uniref:Uncharacterized protein n=1 Tax=Rhizobium jaguaris TaxID=1312183 RepID=A0A387FZC8_9HYPH|nr:hypothetical protein CCGE525_20950 [Rhizobium jaguaris]